MAQTRNATEYAGWKAAVGAAGWTLAQVRCDAPPTAEMLDLMGTIGLRRWERFALRYEREVGR